MPFMPYDPARHHRRSIRLDGYRYDQAGAYCVTICTHQREMLLGGITGGNVELNESGRRVEAEWLALTDRFPTIILDQYVIMPNHVHAIVFLDIPDTEKSVGETTQEPTKKPLLGTVIGVFKSISTIAINRTLDRVGQPFWQKNYYDQIIRNEAMLNGLRRYVFENPADWATDADMLG